MEDLIQKIAKSLEASYSKVEGALKLNIAMFENLQNPEVHGVKIERNFCHPQLLSKCEIRCSNNHNGLFVKKFGNDEKYKILIRCAKPSVSSQKQGGRPLAA